MGQTRSGQFEIVVAAVGRALIGFGAILLPLAGACPVMAQMQIAPTITAVAGNDTAGYSGDGNQATNAQLQGPHGIALDKAGNIYFCDSTNNAVRRIDAATGVITTVAGTGTAGYSGDGGPAASAQLSNPLGLAIDSKSNIYLSDYGNSRVRVVGAITGTITTLVTGISASGLAVDSGDNIYTAENFYVHKIAAGSSTTTIIAGNGSGSYSGDGGPATSAGLGTVTDVAVDGQGNVYIVAAFPYNRIRMVNGTTGIITTVAGNGSTGDSGDGGAATSAQLNGVQGIAVDPSGNLYIGEYVGNRIRGVSNGIITTIAGTGVAGNTGDGGAATLADIKPQRIATDASGNVNFTDSVNNVVRKLTPSTFSPFPATSVGASSAMQTIYLQTTTAETISSITVPQSQGGKQEDAIGAISGCTVDGITVNPAGTVCAIPITFTPAYPGRRWVPLHVVTSTGNINFGLQGIAVGPLAALTPGIISTYAGTGTAGFSGDGGAATGAKLNNPFGLAVDNAGNLYIADFNSGTIRKVSAATGIITTYAGTGTAGYSGDGGPATSAQLAAPRIAFDSAGNLYIADYYNNRIRKVNAATGIVTTIAGTGTAGYSGDGGAATSALLHQPAAVAVDGAGNVYISDANNERIRKVTAGTGIITTIAGNGVVGFSGDGGAATSAKLNNPAGLALDAGGNLYVAEFGNQTVRKVAAGTGIILTVAGIGGSVGYSGDGSAATAAKLNSPEAVSVDNAGNLYIADSGNNRIRRVAAVTGVITTVVGTGTPGYTGDNGTATAAKLNFPSVATFDGAGNLYITDSHNNVIRKVDLSRSALTYPTPTTVGTTDSADDPQTAILSNIGNADLTISPPSSGSNPNVSSSFDWNPASTCPQLFTSSSPQTLASGMGCTIAINFEPIQAGALTGLAVETDNSLNIGGSAQTIHLTATGVAAATATTVTSSLSPSVYGQSVTFTATVAPTTGTALPTGTVQFSVDGTPVGAPVTLNNGMASFPISTLAVGTHTIAASYTPDTTSFTASNGSTSQTVNKIGTTTTVASSVNPSTFMQSVTFTATVAQTAGTTSPTGTVQFAVDGTNQGSPTTLSGGTASFAISTLAVGLHTITAVYAPDVGNFTGSSGSIGQRVGAVASSTTTLTVAPTTVMYGDAATLTAVVAPSFATGTVSFFEGTTLLGTASLDYAATAVLPISTLNAGVHTIVAKYNGDPGVPANTSNTVQLAVTKRTGPGGGPAITVTVSNASRTTTQSNPPFTYSAAGQLVNGDTYATAISGTPSYSTSGGSTPDTYSIALVGLDSANYTIAFVPGTLTVTISPSTTTLVASPSSTQYGDPVTLTATVTSGATGTVSFYDGSVLLGTSQVTNGVAILTPTTLVAGTHSVTAVYNGDATYASSQSNPATVTVAKKQGAGGAAALTITVQNASREYNTADPQFAYIVTGTLVNGDSYATAVSGAPVYSSSDTATSPAGSIFPIGVNGLTSSNYQIAVVSGTLTIVSAPTTTTLTASTASVQYGDPVTLTATVAPSSAIGTVLFTQGSTVLGTGTVTNGVAMLTTSSLNAGAYTITANYEGDSNYSASTSNPVTFTITRRTGPGGTAALTVTVADANRAYGQGNPAFNYTVSGTLVNGDTYATAITNVPVYSTAAIPTSPTGGYSISAADLNSSNYLITVVNGTLTVTKATPGVAGVVPVTLTSSLNPAQYGNSVTLTASVPAPASGTIQFFEGTTLLGTGTVANGIATLTTSTLSIGAHPVTAVYGGDPDYNSATSIAYSQIVTAQSTVLDFNLTLASAGTQTVIPGNTAPYAVQVAPTNVVYPGTVTFSATGLPAGAIISFSPNTVAVDGRTAPIQVTIQTASQAALNHVANNIGSAALAILCVPFAFLGRLRRSGLIARRRLLVMTFFLLSASGLTGLAGCAGKSNGNGFFGQAPQSYTITITATSGTIQHSVAVQLNVQ